MLLLKSVFMLIMYYIQSIPYDMYSLTNGMLLKIPFLSVLNYCETKLNLFTFNP